MTKKLIVCLLLLVIVSCNKDTITSDKITELENQIKHQKIINTSLEEYNEQLKKSKENLENKKSESLEMKKTMSFIIAESLDILSDKKEMIQYVFDDFDLKSYDAYRAIISSRAFYPYGRVVDFETKEMYYSFIILKVDRSPENLRKILTPQVKDNIYSLFKNNNIYKESGSEAMLKASLLIYEDLRGQEDLMAQIYTLGVAQNRTKTLELVSENASEKVQSILKYENYTSYDRQGFLELEDRIWYLYTFWARRHHEGNADYVFELLKEFHTNVATEELVTDDIEL
ncbi:hypothetical protein M4I21_10520 [Cellulophaga sp. 20_2_10]|uniref:hypothetical protein n=1 Tax=Cellulophaga sp. 20_2_10 TaxID=2942476 RepID=UPI00201A8F24|nr:hypothetical protein [Cellulophaga sp. 20_2_10]MCL5246243.1 hypothetical protein [Cellulophaga sp. 20_2_10]